MKFKGPARELAPAGGRLRENECFQIREKFLQQTVRKEVGVGREAGTQRSVFKDLCCIRRRFILLMDNLIDDGDPWAGVIIKFLKITEKQMPP